MGWGGRFGEVVWLLEGVLRVRVHGVDTILLGAALAFSAVDLADVDEVPGKIIVFVLEQMVVDVRVELDERVLTGLGLLLLSGLLLGLHHHLLGSTDRAAGGIVQGNHIGRAVHALQLSSRCMRRAKGRRGWAVWWPDANKATGSGGRSWPDSQKAGKVRLDRCAQPASAGARGDDARMAATEGRIKKRGLMAAAATTMAEGEDAGGGGRGGSGGGGGG